MPKSRNTFEGYQEAKQERREKLIVEYLEHLKTSRVKFQHVTGLAEMVATHITLQEQAQKPCNRATLLRNKRYKALLLTFMAAHLGGGTKNLKLKDVADEKAKSLVVTAQLEASNLRREVDRLKVYVAHLEKQQSGQPAIGAAQVNDEMAQQALHNARLDLTRTCQALFAVLRHFERSVSVDMERGRVIDMSRLRDNVLVDEPLAAPFIEWLRLNRGIGGST
jgi:hypothetical protein